MKRKPFLNEERERYYGVRVGDIIYWNNNIVEVTALVPMDNNAVIVKDFITKAEWGITAEEASQRILKKVEEWTPAPAERRETVEAAKLIDNILNDADSKGYRSNRSISGVCIELLDLHEILHKHLLPPAEGKGKEVE